MKKKLRKNPTSFPSKNILLITSVCFVLGCCIALVAYATILLRVKTVVCVLSTGSQCSKELTEQTHSILGSSLFFSDYEEILSASIQQPVTVVSIQKHLPNSVTLTFAEEKPLYNIQYNGSITTISQTGSAFTYQPEHQSLLEVETTGEVITDQQYVDPEIHQVIVSIIEAANSLQLPLQKMVWVDKSTIKLSIENRSEMFIIDSEHPVLELHRLATILGSNEYRAIEESKSELDLRFSMPVLRTQP